MVNYLLQGLNDYLVAEQNELYYVFLRQKITQHFYHDHLSHPVAQVQNRLTNDLVQNLENYLEAFMEFIGGLTILVSVVVLLLALHWSLLLTIIVMVAVSLLLPKLLEKQMQRAALRISESNRKYLDSLGKWLGGLDELRRYLAGEKLFSVTSKAGKKLEDANVKQTAVLQELAVANGLVSTLFSLILFVLAGYLIKRGLVAFGVIVAVGNCSYYLTTGIQLMVEAYG
ncbi:ABC transporter ATP-binding protein, partial [Lactobacillus sp. XV13L]|nr:ABC transporter ATP-binding protein [Lactobacillus sp. XV13L]